MYKNDNKICKKNLNIIYFFPDFVFDGLKSSAYSKIIKRPLDSYLSTKRIEKALYLNIRYWNSASGDWLKKIQDNLYV